MLLFAIIIITIAHIVRVLRWEFLIETYEEPNRERLTKSLALGYFLNYFLPFKIGDLFRAAYAGKGMENGRGFALATVIVERCLDILSVGVIFVFFSMTGVNSYSKVINNTGASGEAMNSVVYYITLAIVLFAVLVVIYLLRGPLKRIIYNICEFLNKKYEEKLLRFFWALIWGFKDIINRLPKIKLVGYTVLMWGLYLTSYGVFSSFLESAGISRSFGDVFFSLFDQKSLLSSGVVNGFKFSEENWWYGIFMLVPVGILFAVAMFLMRVFDTWTKHRVNVENVSADLENRGVGGSVNSEKLNLIPQANSDERLTFLKMYFAGEKKEYIENYLSINRNILVLRDYSAGSNATTILCTDGENSFYRKYAFMEAAEKLSDQIGWIELNSRRLPVAEIIKKDIKDGVCFYDMPYYHDAVTLFDYCQSGEYEGTWSVLKRVIEILESNIYSNNGDDSETKYGKKGDLLDNTVIDKNDLIANYIDSKVISNLNCILGSKDLGDILGYDTVIINGREYKNINSFLDIFAKESLLKIFENDDITDIHGDLTIENIVYKKSDDSFYLIDPNTGNVFNSKFIDYAKILQSLHGRYEYLMAIKEVYVSGNRIDFKNIESDAYDYLYERYRGYLDNHFSKSQIQSMYYHEVVNWLRLMPYKIKKGKGLLFYAGLIILLNDIVWAQSD